ncbi:hypothetical protein AAFF_G00211220 [Aldrovandia affinis]|uniref:Uncharacterized protein n=1 Tax=Aldrovandia affinis TaxID=143900 RepID=A0AAD7WUK9_9TELE|nr:hypothetical protein AAFF_G00211220 [Aldrovandia affinis]
MRRPHRGGDRLCGFALASTKPLPEGESSEAPGVVEGTAQEEEEEEGLSDLFLMDQEATPGPAPLAGCFGMAQLEDPNLTSALQQVSVVDGQLMDGGTAGSLCSLTGIRVSDGGACLAAQG